MGTLLIAAFSYATPFAWWQDAIAALFVFFVGGIINARDNRVW